MKTWQKHLLPLLTLAATALSCRAGAAPQLVPLKNSAGKNVHYAGRLSDAPVMIPVSYQAKARELRGVWVATVENIDFAQHDNAGDFRQEYLTLLTRLQQMNINAVFFQIRPLNDAFYPSKLNPWSRFLTGKEGREIPGLDP
ncbi:MAG: family 10 glycosylhydrolase, partial [Victivallales bacterium]|nr:family 10 glycosylhydrolase [Victivallales bacterium]